MVSKDLCILYSRLAALRAVASIGASEERESLVKSFCDCLGPGNGDGEASEHTVPLVNVFLSLLRLCGMHSVRTKVYFQTMQILPSKSLLTASIGSVFLNGGRPALHALSRPVSDILKSANEALSHLLIDKMLKLIKTETCRSTSREFANSWKHDGGTCPVIINSNITTDSIGSETPNLMFAFWMSVLLMDNLCSANLSIPAETPLTTWTRTAQILIDLCQSWMFATRSPHMAVKLCGTRILTLILQDMSTPGGRFVEIPTSLVLDFYKSLPIDRIRKLLNNRLSKEKGAHPIYSEYLQALFELVICIDNILTSQVSMHKEDLETGSPSQCCPAGDHVAAMNTLDEDTNNVKFDIAAMSGFGISDSGWELWTGSIQQDKIDWPEFEYYKSFLSGTKSDNHHPPTLLPGSKVARERPKDETAAITETASDDAGSSENKVVGVVSIITPISPKSSPSPSPGGHAAAAAVVAVAAVDAAANADAGGSGGAAVSADEDIASSILSSSASNVAHIFRRFSSSQSFTEKIASAMSAAVPGPTTSTTDVGTLDEEIGTVIEITQWPGGPLGSARKVQWENGDITEVRWGFEGILSANSVLTQY